jgi:hypothetical protein
MSQTAPIPFVNSPASITRSASVEGSVRSFRSVDDLGDDWNVETLREMTDVVREALRTGFIPKGEMEILSEILTVLLIDEQAMHNAVDLNCIALTYFDKVLEAIMSKSAKDIAAEEPHYQEIHAKATSLQHRWQQRFKERYFSIDEYRINDMRSRALRDLTLNLPTNLEDWKPEQLWLVTKSEPISHKEGGLGFESGR